MDQVRVITFAGGFNLALWAARGQGFFERNGIQVELSYTADSRQVFSGLHAGIYDLAMTALDNIVAHQEGHARPVTDGFTDFVAVMGSDDGFLSLVGAPDKPTIKSLTGSTISVDDPANGFSALLRDMLVRGGLAGDSVGWISAGGTDRRYEQLITGKHGATMLRTPFELMALQQGCHLLARPSDVVGPYMGIVAAARRAWAAGHASQLVAFIRAYRDAVAWLKSPANRVAAERLLRSEVPAISASMAAAACDEMLHPIRGFFGDVRIDHVGTRTVLDLRSRYGPSQQPLRETERYIDEFYWQAAKV